MTDIPSVLTIAELSPVVVRYDPGHSIQLLLDVVNESSRTDPGPLKGSNVNHGRRGCFEGGDSPWRTL